MAGSRDEVRVCMVSSVHHPFDTRVFFRESRSLRQSGFEVVLLAPHDCEEMVDGIRIVPVRKPNGRLARALFAWRVACKAASIRPDVYHFHDPELIPAMLALRALMRKPVVYDAHEDYGLAVLHRDWIPTGIRGIVRRIVDALEPRLSRLFDVVITADEGTAERFKAAGHSQVEVVHNFPIATGTSPTGFERQNGVVKLVYVGRLSRERGACKMLEVLNELRHRHVGDQIELHLIGSGDASVEGNMQAYIAKHRLAKVVVCHGYVRNDQIPLLLSKCDIALLLVSPGRFVHNIPTKMFEYMLACLPIIATCTPTTEKYLSTCECARLIDGDDPLPYADAIEYLIQDREGRMQMGKRGRSAVLGRYNWEMEAKHLISIYLRLVKEELK